MPKAHSPIPSVIELASEAGSPLFFSPATVSGSNDILNEKPTKLYLNELKEFNREFDDALEQGITSESAERIIAMAKIVCDKVQRIDYKDTASCILLENLIKNFAIKKSRLMLLGVNISSEIDAVFDNLSILAREISDTSDDIQDALLRKEVLGEYNPF